MPRTKRDVAELKKRAINSLVLGIELFNRPHDAGRAESVLMLLHHAFEMLLKAIIIEGGIDVEEVWQRHRDRFVGKKRR